MSNILQDIIATQNNACDGETIESIVVGQLGLEIGSDGFNRGIHERMLGRVLSWNDDIKDMFNYNYNSSYGDADCHPIQAFTENFIIYVNEMRA